MTKIVLDLEQLNTERTLHEEAIKRIDAIISYYFKNSVSVKHLSIENNAKDNSMSRMQQAIKICEEYLREGNKIYSIKEFMRLLDERGIRLSRAGVGLAFKKPESNICFDQIDRTWKLKSQG